MAEYTLVRKLMWAGGLQTGMKAKPNGTSIPRTRSIFLGNTASCGSRHRGGWFAAPELYVAEGSGVTVEMLVSYPLEDVEFEVAVTGGDATDGADFPAVFPLNFTFESGLLNSQSFNFVAIDDEEPELQEDVELTLTILSGDAILGIQSLVIHILPSDLTYPVYDIAQVRGTNNQGELDSLNTSCELRGIAAGTITHRAFGSR